jgi:hypothetical protein
MDKLTAEQKDFIIDLLKMHAEGMTQWYDKDKGWYDQFCLDEYEMCREILEALGE